MTQITYVSTDDTRHTVDAPDGESLMRVALQHDIPGIVGECGGELTCGTCHVYVSDEWSDRVEPESEGERELLSMMDGVRPESRLACQIRVQHDMHGFTARISDHQ
ncbi:2Fe-2S iron-sulfur cluster-binding protein [Arthrobacter sp. S39]|uniref:2Fe-2S iron-sulfur cluster-binding protein n=1 Tax=Arthrobacter sp. S39 TaxID=2509720 RepID=UPI001037426C|nr:2Fe-2S iron-sulfur cluster-binding protein [Arthrobacter sp. S39]TAP39157.1 2Fe-2S iron-sulfur cluster binding domain-containing protein [Arthrobacter sp. S39]